MALYDGTNAPALNVYIDTGNRNQGKFILNYSLLGGSDTLGSYVPFTILSPLNINEVKRVSIRRGRTREDQDIQPGDLTLVLDNTLGNFDPEFVISAAVSAATGSGTAVTYTAVGHTYKIGQIVSVYGLTTSSFNLSYKVITAITSTTFTVASTVTGTLTGQSGIAYSGYSNSSGEPILIQGTGIRVTAKWTGYEIPLYSGYIEQMDKDLSLEPTVTITCVDGLAKIAKMFVKTDTDTLGDYDAIVKILRDGGWYGTLGGSDTNDYYLNRIPKGTALEMINQIASQGIGMFYVDTYNKATWLNYNALGPGTFGSPNITLSDRRTSTSEIEYDGISIIGGEKYLINTVTATNTFSDDSTQVITKFNSTSVGRYGPVAKEVDIYIAGTNLQPTAPADAVQALADQFASSAYRVDEVSFECVGFSSTLWYNFIVFCDLSFRVTVKRTTIYGGDYTYNGRIQQVTHDITPDSWRTSLTLSPAT